MTTGNPMVDAFLTALATQQSRPMASVQAAPVGQGEFRQAPVGGLATYQGNDGQVYASDGWQQGSYGDAPGIWESFRGNDGHDYYRDWGHSGEGSFAPNTPMASIQAASLQHPDSIRRYDETMAQMPHSQVQQPDSRQAVAPGVGDAHQMPHGMPSEMVNHGFQAPARSSTQIDPGFLIANLAKRRMRGQPAQVSQLGQ